MTRCAHCHQPIVDTPLDRLMKDLRRLNLDRAMQAARIAAAARGEAPPAPARWSGEGYDE